MYTTNSFVAFEESATLAPKLPIELNSESIQSICPHHNPFHFNNIITHPSLFACSYFAVSQIRGVALRMKMHDSDPSTDRSIKTVRQLEHTFEPYRMVFWELKGKGSSCHHNVCAKKMKTLNNYSRIFAFRGGGGGLET
jgi:hypothetical protein